MFWQQISRGLETLIWPSRCAGCDRCDVTHGGGLSAGLFCPACDKTLIRVVSPKCPRCDLPFEGSGPNHLCGDCLASPPHFEKMVSVYQYGGAIADAVKRFKYLRRTHLARPLGELLFPRVRLLPRPDFVVPVPLYPQKLRERGFNQSALLGAVVAGGLRVPMDAGSLTRVRFTRSQAGLSREERMANIKGAFRTARPRRVRGKRILVVDDVITTGTTVREAAFVLRQAGAEAVYVAAVARAC